VVVSRVLAVLLVLVACGEPDDDLDPDPTDEMFDPDRLLEVDIELAPADWDAVRFQARDASILLGADCQDQPFPNPYTYVTADVTVDGERREKVGLRKKGFFGSLDSEKPSLKIKLDELAANPSLSGLDRLTFNNSKQDPGFVRQCLGYALFAGAEIPAPRCNFARLRLNGEPLGLFVHVESVKKRFLRRHFTDDEGRLFEGTLSDFRAGWSGTFEIKTNKQDPDRSAIDALAAALEVPDDELLEALDPLLDVERFLTFWAMEVLIGHWDGYANNTNNFFVYQDPGTGLLEFMPWGIDGTFADQNPFPAGEGPPRSVYATGLLARRLYQLPETRDRYVARVRELLDTVWDEDALLAEIDRMQDVIGDDAATDRFGEGRFTEAIDEARSFVRGRRAQLEAELEPLPAWSYPLRESFCFVEIGAVSGDFQTTFGTLDRPDPFAAGTGTLSGDLRLAPIATTVVGSKAGFDADNPGKVQTQVIAQLESGTILVVAFGAQAGLFAAGATIPLEPGGEAGVVIELDPATGSAELLGIVFSGAVELDAAGTTGDDPVEGSFAGTIYQSPF
jgi:hypothetical protein